MGKTPNKTMTAVILLSSVAIGVALGCAIFYIQHLSREKEAHTIDDEYYSSFVVINRLESLPLTQQIIKIETCIVTAYAPLDPLAVKGMDYIGDRTIGADGKKVVPNVTVAAAKDIPFGTKVKIEGIDQIFTVGDRGSRITEGHLDICMLTRSKALAFGRQKRAVVFYNED